MTKGGSCTLRLTCSSAEACLPRRSVVLWLSGFPLYGIWTLKPSNVSTYYIPPPPTCTASLPHCKTAKQSSPSFIWTHARFNHPATPSQMSDNALSPSFLTQVMGFSKCQRCIYFKRICKMLVFMGICGCCKSKKTYLHRENVPDVLFYIHKHISVIKETWVAFAFILARISSQQSCFSDVLHNWCWPQAADILLGGLQYRPHLII